MGQKGRIAFLAAHERSLCCYQWMEVMRDLVRRPSVARPRSVRRREQTMMPAGSLGRGGV
jgi:hypothetical protein